MRVTSSYTARPPLTFRVFVQHDRYRAGATRAFPLHASQGANERRKATLRDLDRLSLCDLARICEISEEVTNKSFSLANIRTHREVTHRTLSRWIGEVLTVLQQEIEAGTEYKFIGSIELILVVMFELTREYQRSRAAPQKLPVDLVVKMREVMDALQKFGFRHFRLWDFYRDTFLKFQVDILILCCHPFEGIDTFSKFARITNFEGCIAALGSFQVRGISEEDEEVFLEDVSQWCSADYSTIRNNMKRLAAKRAQRQEAYSAAEWLKVYIKFQATQLKILCKEVKRGRRPAFRTFLEHNLDVLCSSNFLFYFPEILAIVFDVRNLSGPHIPPVIMRFFHGFMDWLLKRSFWPDGTKRAQRIYRMRILLDLLLHEEGVRPEGGFSDVAQWPRFSRRRTLLALKRDCGPFFAWKGRGSRVTWRPTLPGMLDRCGYNKYTIDKKGIQICRPRR